MKTLIITALATIALNAFAANTTVALDIRAAKECKQYAINHALKAERAISGGEISLMHLDRSIPMGTLIGDKGEEEGYINVQVILSRESSDPIVYEMAITAKTKKGSKTLSCKVTKEVTRELL